MAKAYTKEDIVEAALQRFSSLAKDRLEGLRTMYNNFYDTRGKDTFRTYASVTPIVIKTYFESKK